MISDWKLCKECCCFLRIKRCVPVIALTLCTPKVPSSIVRAGGLYEFLCGLHHCLHQSASIALWNEPRNAEGKVVPGHVMKAYSGSGSIAPHILNLGIGWRWVVSLASRLLYLRGKETRVPIEWAAGWATVLVWTFWDETDLLPMLEFESLIVHPVAWSVYWLRFPGARNEPRLLSFFPTSSDLPFNAV